MVGGDVPEQGAPLPTPTEGGAAEVPHYEVLEMSSQQQQQQQRTTAAARFVTLDRPFEAEAGTDPSGLYDKATDMAPDTNSAYDKATDVPAGDSYDEASGGGGMLARSGAVALCKHVSATGRPCKNDVGGAAAAAGGEHCDSHTCGAPGCTQPKSSTERCCPLH